MVPCIAAPHRNALVWLRVLTLPAWVLLSLPLPACNKGREPARNKRAQEGSSGATSSSAPSSKPSSAPSTATPALAPMTLEFARPLKGAAVVDYLDPGESARTCQVNRACKPFAPLKPCEAGIEPIEASALGAFVPRARGERVSVRGPLGLTLLRAPFVAANPQMHCIPTWIEVFVGRVPDGVRLEGLTCYGDVSRICCPVPAFGQVVVATGRIMQETDRSVLAHGGRFVLADPVLCAARVAQSAPLPAAGAPPSL